MFAADRLTEILEELGISSDELSTMLGGGIDVDSILSGKAAPSTEQMSGIEKVLHISKEFLFDESKVFPVMEMSLGEFSHISKARAIQFIDNLDSMLKVLKIERNPWKKFLVKSEKDISSIVNDIMQSGFHLSEYLQSRGIYTIELDRCSGFEGAVYSYENSLFIILNKDHSDKRKFEMLIELSANCLLYFDQSLSEEEIDTLSVVFCEEILKNLPCEQTFSILAHLVALAVDRHMISTSQAARYMCVPIYFS